MNQVLVRPKILNCKKLKNMTINELSKEQFTELKWRYLDEIYQEETNESISLEEIVNIDNIISDEEILNEYSNYVFSDDDFFCTTN